MLTVNLNYLMMMKLTGLLTIHLVNKLKYIGKNPESTLKTIGREMSTPPTIL